MFFITQSLQCLVEEAAMAMAYPKDSAINLPWRKLLDVQIKGSQAQVGVIQLYRAIYQAMLIYVDTPWKINMEPTNHPFRKENDLPNLHDYVPC